MIVESENEPNQDDDYFNFNWMLMLAAKKESDKAKIDEEPMIEFNLP